MGGNLEELSRDLSFSTTQHSPEEFIRKTLLAHGFFNHARDTRQDETSEEPSTVGKQPASGISEEDKRRTTQLISHFREGKEVHMLKEPRSLFNHPCKQQEQKKMPLWPSEVACISQRPRFLSATPPSPEPFYYPEQDVVSPKIRSGEGGGTVVYCNTPGPEKYFTLARAGPSQNAHATPTRPAHNTTLEFESRFESGNLAKAVQVGRWDYELYLRFDLYTHKHTQWFYFRVSNMRAGQTYRFTITNLYKAGSLYNKGMQPVFYSEVDARERGVGWRRAGHNIKYFQTPLRRQDTRQESYYYGLTWSYTFQHAGDVCYFAHCYPYTYSDLQDYLHGLMSDQRTAKFCKQRTLCHTIAGNPVPILTITSHIHTPEESKAKRAVVVTARVHPGETNGSWMMKGLLDFLTGSSPDALILRDTFIFKIVPMLNPDGVIVGNYRCSLAGRDLNRNYRTKLKEAYPTVWHTKAMVKRLVGEREVVVYCDLHGHSKKHNVFIYGCDDLADPALRLRARVFPFMLSKNAPSKFSYRDSKFGVQKSKEGTGRVVMWREMGVRNSYTMESTFCGSLLGQQSGLQFTPGDLESMGYCFCDTLLDYCDPDQTKVERVLHDLEEELRQSILARLARMGREVPPGVDLLALSVDSDLASDSSDSGSDSSESDGPPVHLVKDKKKKRKKLKSRKERNKHKALLKLTHGKTQGEPRPPPNATQLPPPTHTTEVPLQNAHPPSVPCPPAADPTPFRYSPIDTARNGGMPMFIQERLEERQRKRNDLQPSGSLSDEQEYVEAVAMSYLQQGLPHSSLQDSTQDPRSSTPFLPHPSCPISISQMNLREKSASRPSSKTSLPQLLPPPPLPPFPLESPSHAMLASAAGSHAVFASQYVANHLQEIINDTGGLPSSTSVTTSNNTRNLANLSRLFRQLKPHLAHSMAKETRVPYRNPSKPELQGQLQPNGEKEGRGEEAEKPTKVEFLPVGNGDVSTSKHLQKGPREKFPQGSSLHTLSKHLEQVALKKSEVRRPTTPSRQNRSPKLLRASKDQADKLTRQDQKMATNIRSSCSSPATSSWESFTQPVTLMGRAEVDRRSKEERETASVELQQPPTASIGAELLAEQLRGKTDQFEVFMRTASEGRRKQTKMPVPQLVRKSCLTPDQTSSPQALPAAELSGEKAANPTAASVRSHKRRIADAVESMQERRKLFRKPAEPTGPVAGKRGVATPQPQTSDTGQASRPTGVRRSQSDWAASGRSTGSAPPPSSGDISEPGPPSLQLTRSAVGLTSDRNISTLDQYIPVPSSRVFSSKPLSRYGPRPTAGDGVTPATVSLMLSGRIKPRPSTMHGSRSRKPRNLTVRYFTKKSSLFHID